MKVNQILFIPGFILSFTFSLTTYGQVFPENGLSRDSLLSVSREIMKNAGNCALITLDKNGSPKVRTMDPFPPEDNMEVWLGTNSKSRKVGQIKNDSRVSLYYFDKDNSGYLIIYGKAILVDDPQIKEVKWKEDWEAFYPDRNESYILIRVIPETLEVLSPAHGVMNDPVTWQPPVIKFN